MHVRKPDNNRSFNSDDKKEEGIPKSYRHGEKKQQGDLQQSKPLMMLLDWYIQIEKSVFKVHHFDRRINLSLMRDLPLEKSFCTHILYC